MPTSPELQITLSSPTDVAARAPDGREADGKINTNELRRVTVEMFDTLLRKGPMAYRRALEVLGMHLYDMVFSSEVEKLFLDMRGKLKPGEKLRVLLIFRKEALSLAGLPWEYLYGPDTDNRLGYYFSTDKDLTFARFLRLDSPREQLAPESSPLRITIISSRPSLLNPILHRPVIEEIRKLPGIELGKTIEQPTRESLLKKLEEFAKKPPHVLHFMGHGQFLGDRGQIALLRRDGETADWVDDKEFAGYFRQKDCLPRLVVLHLCEGARVSFPSHFGGIAPQLVMAGVPAVVAMQYPITNQTAIDFSCAFYQHVGLGEPIDHAVQSARYTAMTKITPESGDERVFGAPVLYLQSWNGVINPPKQASQSPEFGRTQEGVTLGSAPPSTVLQPFMTEAKAAGFAAADRNQLDIVDVSKAIRATPWAATAPEVRLQLVDLLDSANSLAPVWAAMLTAIEKEIAR